ncbi:MAG: class I SAM-dependent methyltransferase [Gammaproteobacteria bacterium]|nr:class I SAM-dependent methyltransferase [Gammaproteobacteria bacterium]
MTHHYPLTGLPKAHRQFRAHMWIFGAFGLIAGLILLVYVPTLEAVSRSLLLFAGFHLMGALVLGATLYFIALRRLLRRLIRPQTHGRVSDVQQFNFGWGPAWMNGLAIAALVTAFIAVAVQTLAPAWWPLSFLLIFLAANFIAGNQLMRSIRRPDHVVLPMVDVLSGDEDLVLDAGCGTGRTSIALGRVLKKGRIVALDRFDAGYIDDGGRALLESNLRLASLADRVQIETGDLTALPFPDNHFDSAVSTHVFDHLGRNKEVCLREIRRVLKPGGCFLMAVWVPGWSMFTVANVLSWLLSSRTAWKEMAVRAGLAIVDEGVFNGTWFVVLEKPALFPRPADTLYHQVDS